jgi:hypothetical protein
MPMATLMHRDRGPEKKSAEMSQSEEGVPRHPDRRHQRAWVPGTAALLTLLIGASDIYAVLNPDWPHRSSRRSCPAR